MGKLGTFHSRGRVEQDQLAGHKPKSFVFRTSSCLAG
jgi:hypothetical protein